MPPTELQLLTAKWERWCAELLPPIAPRDSENSMDAMDSEDEMDVATLQPMAMPSLA